MSSYGRRDLETGGQFRRLSVDPTDREMKPGGITVDWTTVTALASPLTLEGVTIPTGTKLLIAGQIVTEITASGKYGPYDSAMSDGRQLLARGKCYAIDETTFELDGKSDHPPALEGGLIWKSMLRATTGTASLANGPTFATLEPVMPGLRYAQ